MSFEVDCVDHHRLFLNVIGSQTDHHRSEDSFVAPPQAIAIDEGNAAQHLSIINVGLAMRLRKKWRKARHLSIAQPEKIRHVYRSFFEP